MPTMWVWASQVCLGNEKKVKDESGFVLTLGGKINPVVAEGLLTGWPEVSLEALGGVLRWTQPGAVVPKLLSLRKKIIQE